MNEAHWCHVAGFRVTLLLAALVKVGSSKDATTNCSNYQVAVCSQYAEGF